MLGLLTRKRVNKVETKKEEKNISTLTLQEEARVLYVNYLGYLQSTSSQPLKEENLKKVGFDHTPWPFLNTFSPS